MTGERLPEISRTIDEATGDLVWTLRIPQMITTDVWAVQQIKLRVAVWVLRLAANAIEDHP